MQQNQQPLSGTALSSVEGRITRTSAEAAVVPLAGALCMSLGWWVRCCHSAALLSPWDGRPIVYIVQALSISLPLISIATKYLYPFFLPHSQRHQASKSTRLLFLAASSNQLAMTTGRPKNWPIGTRHSFPCVFCSSFFVHRFPPKASYPYPSPAFK